MTTNHEHCVRAAGRTAEQDKPKQLKPDSFLAQLVITAFPATVLIVAVVIFELLKGV